MRTLLCKVIWYRLLDKGLSNSPIDNRWYDETGINITDLVNFNTAKGMDIQNNILTTELKNPIQYSSKYRYVSDNGNIMFEEQDQIKVWAKWAESKEDIEGSVWKNNNEVPSDNPIGIYYVIEFDPKHIDKSTGISLKCADKTYVLFNRLVTYPFTGDTDTPRMIQKVIRLATMMQPNEAGGYLGTGEDSENNYYIQANLNNDQEKGYITSVRRTIKENGSANSDTAFPSYNLSKVWKPAYEWINDLSQVGYTNNQTELNTSGEYLTYGRPFIYWIDELNKFHWIYPSQDEWRREITIGTDTDVLSINISKKVFDVTNMVIFNAGKNMYDVGITGYLFDPTTDAKTLKMTYVPMEDIAKIALQSDYNQLDENARDSGDWPQFPASYPTSYIPAWGSFTYDGDSYGVVANDTEYNDSLVAYCRMKGKLNASSLIQGVANARWTGNIELLGQLFSAGDLIKITDSAIGLNKELLRIMDVRHNFTKAGWFTTIEVEKDAKALINQTL